MKKNTCKECQYSSNMIAIGMGFRCTHPQNVDANWNLKKHNPAVIPHQNFICDQFKEQTKDNDEMISKSIVLDIPQWTKYLEVGKLTQWRFTYEKFSNKVKELHLMLFLEEYHMFELDSDSFSQEYLEMVNHKRQSLGISPISVDGKTDLSSRKYCENIVKEEQNYLTYDFIADVHGRFSLLKDKLIKLGYEEKNGCFTSKSRRAIFLGDLVDRGPEVAETLKLVKQMCETGVAQAILGNHDWNWLMYNTQDQEGNFLRKHSEKNNNQNQTTREAWKKLHISEQEEILTWLSNLPLTLETEEYRVVHACWNGDVIKKLKQSIYPNPVNFKSLKEFIVSKEGKKIKNYADILLSGIEYNLPQGITFKDVDDNIRNAVRLKWWCLDQTNDLKDLALQPELVQNIDTKVKSNYQFEKELKPTFFGHYHNKEYVVEQSKKLYSLDIQEDIGICSIYKFEDQNTYLFN